MHIKPFIAIIGALLIGIVAGSFIHRTTTTVMQSSVLPPVASSDFQFINPTVTSNLGKHFIINFSSLKEELIAIQKKYSGKTYVYFDYLNNASWVGLNEKDLFTAASTVKVPLAMALFKAVEDKKITLDDTYALDELDLDAHFGDLYQVGPDKKFSVEELIKIMLEKSDNTAAAAVTSVLKKIGINDPLEHVYDFLGWQSSNAELIPDMGSLPTYQNINLKTLANMFLALYNATYLTSEHSEQILKYLANTPFDEKIAAGVPRDIPVAHKIGVAATSNTFSDCGIVYAPNRHYVLCVGLSGVSESDAIKFISEISQATYQFVINN